MMNWQKAMGTVLAGAMIFGTSMTALAAEGDGAAQPRRERIEQRVKEKALEGLTAEQKAVLESLRQFHEELKEQREQIMAEREELKEKAGTIRELIRELRQDEERNRSALEKARVDLQELKLIREDLQQVSEERRALRPAFREAIQNRDGDEAGRIAREALRLGEIKLDLLKAANVKASQAIAHLKGAAQGQGQGQ